MRFLLPHLLDESADEAPTRDAFRVPGRTLSYAQASEASNQLARALREQGVRRGDRVAIFLPRCLETAIAVYGVMKAGAAFVPVDPHLPAAGVRRLLQDCGIRHAISQSALAATLAELSVAGDLEAVYGVDSALAGNTRCITWSEIGALSTAALPLQDVTEDDLAYLIYSSGSTGRPKGIMHTHRSGMAYARLSVDTYAVRSDDCIANHSPLHFDMSTFGYLSSPLAGATTLIVPDAHTKLAASLSRLIEEQQVTIWYSVPLALIQLLLRGALDERDLHRLRWIMYGGEPFPPRHLAALMAAWPQARFSNVYGPAEVNQCTYYHLPSLDQPDSEARQQTPVPIGSIWADTAGLVLDAEDRRIDDDSAGELVIRSPTMMRGYWGRPDLNARAFFRVERDGGFVDTYYRTGDLVRRRDDGQLMFLGRMDRQVKVRGYRVDLDDVEHALNRHVSVTEAAAFPVRDGEGDDHIAATLIARDPAGFDAPALLRHLEQELPAYAVPSRISAVAELPRTGSGKIDRRRLQEMAENADKTEVVDAES